MIKRTYEWYRVVNTSPAEETIRARKLAVEGLIKKIDESDNYSLLIDCAAGTVGGFEISFSDSNAINSIVSSIQEHQQAFPSDITDNALELRVCASIAIGEILTRQGQGSSDDAILTSAVLISGFGLKAEPQEQYLRAMLSELKDAAHEVSQRAAMEKRERAELDLEAINVAAPPDVAALWKILIPFLKVAFEQLENQARSDREELDVLWWLYGNYSAVAHRHLNSLKPYEAALCAGLEVADLTKVPSCESVRQMVAKAAEANRKSESLKSSRLESIVRQWNEPEMKSLAPQESEAQAFVKTYPTLVPLTWLVSRIVESGVKTGWADEFEKKTGIELSSEFGPTVIAKQVFDERVAQRIHQEIV